MAVQTGVLVSAVRAIHFCAILLPQIAQMTSAWRCWMLGSCRDVQGDHKEKMRFFDL